MKKNALILAVLFISQIGIITAQSPEERGIQIASLADKADEGFGSLTNKTTMILKNKQGQESTRYMGGKTLELTTDGDKSMIVFESPKDVKGTATLTFTHKEGPDDQWLYLPAIKRVKRISSSNKSGPFMGSEFAYEDLSSQEVEKYTYKFLREESINGVDAYVVERYPLDPKSGYTKQIVWWNQNNYRLEKIDFYDRKESLLKTLTYQGYKLYLDKHWRSDEMKMVNHQSEKSTRLVFSDYAFKVGLTDGDFTQNSLIRVGR